MTKDLAMVENLLDLNNDLLKLLIRLVIETHDYTDLKDIKKDYNDLL